MASQSRLGAAVQSRRLEGRVRHRRALPPPLRRALDVGNARPHAAAGFRHLRRRHGAAPTVAGADDRGRAGERHKSGGGLAEVRRAPRHQRSDALCHREAGAAALRARGAELDQESLRHRRFPRRPRQRRSGAGRHERHVSALHELPRHRHQLRRPRRHRSRARGARGHAPSRRRSLAQRRRSQRDGDPGLPHARRLSRSGRRSRDDVRARAGTGIGGLPRCARAARARGPRQSRRQHRTVQAAGAREADEARSGQRLQSRRSAARCGADADLARAPQLPQGEHPLREIHLRSGVAHGRAGVQRERRADRAGRDHRADQTAAARSLAVQAQ